MDWHTRDTSTLETFPGMRFFGFRSSLEQTIKSYALFANADYEVTSNFTVQGGVRYTNTKRKASHCSEDISSDQALSRTFGNSEIVPGSGTTICRRCSDWVRPTISWSIRASAIPWTTCCPQATPAFSWR